MARILLIDDDPALLDALSLALQDEGYEVDTAEDGLAGLEKLRESRPDVLVSDINMPRLDGFGFIERVRADESCRGIPILVLTTESDEGKKLRARAAGATGWIVKPFDPAKLVGALARVLA